MKYKYQYNMDEKYWTVVSAKSSESSVHHQWKEHRFSRYDSSFIKRQLTNSNQIVFEVTDACNLKCKYCGYGEFYDNYDIRKAQNMPTKIGIQMIDFLVSLWESECNL